MVCNCGRGCEESMTMYPLGMEREHDGVRLRMWMQRELVTPHHFIVDAAMAAAAVAIAGARACHY